MKHHVHVVRQLLPVLNRSFISSTQTIWITMSLSCSLITAIN